MPHTLYAIHGSHPCVCAERALQLKGQPYRIHEMPPSLHLPEQWLRFRTTIVPVLVLGSGERIVGSRAIVHRLDELVPEPRLLPADAAERARVVAAERWGDDVLQSSARRLFYIALAVRPDAIDSYAEGSQLPVPAPLRRLLARPFGLAARLRHRAGVARAREDLAALPGQLDQVDAWIREGLMGGAEPNAADLQIAPSVRLLSTMGDVRPWLEGRPSLALALRMFPGYAGHMPAGSLPL